MNSKIVYYIYTNGYFTTLTTNFANGKTGSNKLEDTLTLTADTKQETIIQDEVVSRTPLERWTLAVASTLAPTVTVMPLCTLRSFLLSDKMNLMHD